MGSQDAIINTHKTRIHTNIGIKTRNPFLNFLREFRMNTNERKMSVVSQIAAVEWRKMTEAEKMPYIMMARSLTELNKNIKLRPKSRKELLIERAVDWNSVSYVN